MCLDNVWIVTMLDGFMPRKFEARKFRNLKKSLLTSSINNRIFYVYKMHILVDIINFKVASYI
jgi:hypothetical protein